MKTVFPGVHTESNAQFFEKVFRNTYNGIAIIDFKGRFIKLNESVCELLGYSKEELLTMSFRDITFREDLKKSDKRFKKLGEGDRQEIQLRIAEGCPQQNVGVILRVAHPGDGVEKTQPELVQREDAAGVDDLGIGERRRQD